MDLVDLLNSLPDPAKMVIILNLDLNSLAVLSHVGFREFLSDPYNLEKLAIAHNLPISDSFGQLLKYSRMKPETLLVTAIGKGDLRVATAVLDVSPINMRTLSKIVVYAATEGHLEIVQLLFDRGAELVPRKKQLYDEVMDGAARGGHTKIVQMMLDKGAKDYDEAMSSAARGGHIEIVKMMLDKGAEDYDDAMSMAAQGGHIEIVRLMIEKGANRRHDNESYNLPMAMAALEGHIEIVHLMIEKGATGYDLAMINAALGGHIEIVQFFLDMESDLIHNNKNYDMVMKMAALRGHDKIMELIRSYL